jgi:single-strand DNA-binding protein
MASFNKVILLGNLTRDPELRVTTGGSNICKFGLACSRSFTAQDGSKREETLFVDVDAFGRPAEVISKYMAKGRPILVEGRLRLDQWETQSGDKRSKHTVVLESFQFVGARGENEGSPSEHSYASSAPASRRHETDAAMVVGDIDDDVPF